MDIKQVEGTRLRELVERRLRLNEVEAAVKLFHQHACLMCKVFGAPSYGAHVYFGDAYVIGEYTLNTRTGIAIDRRTGAAFQGALYTVEYVEPGTIFRLDIKTTNLPNYVLGMFAKILKMIDRGEVRVGGFKTRGFGELRLKSLNIKIKDLHKPGSRVLEKLDERDIETDLNGLVEIQEGFLYVEGEGARQVLDKLEEVWNRANL
jgi:CRISPR/Cas system CSM-associated protein Csm3 (group 7 of RAMP superfamily)